MRKLVVKRRVVVEAPKEDPVAHEAAESPDKEAAEEAATEDGEPMPEVDCPNCGCHIDTVTGKEIKGKDAPDDGEGVELDESDSAYAKPGPFGTASDAARGTEAQAKLLGALRK